MEIFLLLRAFRNNKFCWPFFMNGKYSSGYFHLDRDNSHLLMRNDEKEVIELLKWNTKNSLSADALSPQFFYNAALLLKLEVSYTIASPTSVSLIEVAEPVKWENVSVYWNGNWQSANSSSFKKRINELKMLYDDVFAPQIFDCEMRKFLHRNIQAMSGY